MREPQVCPAPSSGFFPPHSSAAPEDPRELKTLHSDGTLSDQETGG